MSQTIQETEKFNAMNSFAAKRLETCMYRFYKIIQTRKAEVPKLVSGGADPIVQCKVQQKILTSVDEYVNCLRSKHRGGEIPEYLQ